MWRNSSMQAELLIYASLSRLLFVFLAVICNIFIPDHHAEGVELYRHSCISSTSGNISITDSEWSQLDNSWLTFTKWDSAYYLHVAQTGYTEEKEFAFYPLYPYFIRCVSYALVIFLPSLQCSDTRAIVSGLLISNLSFLGSTIVLRSLLHEVGIHSKAAVRTITLCFVFNPATVFFISVYSESLYAFLSWSAMLLFLTDRFVLASLLLSITSLCRSNNMLNLVFYVAVIVQQSINRVNQVRATEQRKYPYHWQQWLWLLRQAARCAFLGLCTVGPHVLWQCYIKYKLCIASSSSIRTGQHSSICSEDLLEAASIYTFVQQKYWNVGLFRYYQLKQVPNFLLAAPALITALQSIRLSSCTDNIIHRALVAQMISITGTLLLFSHIQISTRLLCASSPLLYITLYSFWHSPREWVRRLFITYMISYIVVGICLHVNFYPWT
jgi:phosphatidylinositol glycan class V